MQHVAQGMLVTLLCACALGGFCWSTTEPIGFIAVGKFIVSCVLILILWSVLVTAGAFSTFR